MRKFRLLHADEIEVRVARVTQYGVQLLLYKTARTDAALLDETYPEQWQNDYKAIDGKMYCGIGIKMGAEWHWRWNCGVESNMEATKGEASDAFKRAGFMWGIGAELYTSPRITVKPDACKIDGTKCNDFFEVSDIGYDNAGRINRLMIYNRTQRKPAYTFGAAKPQTATAQEPTPAPAQAPAPALETAPALTDEPKRAQESSRDILIKTLIIMAKNANKENSVNKEGFLRKGKRIDWSEASDDILVQIQAWLKSFKQNKEAGAA